PAHAVPLRVQVHRRAIPRPLAPMVFEEADRLEESEAVGRLEQVPNQASTFSPIRGGHRRSSPSRPLTVAIIFENELMVQYRPRNRSRTPAKRNRPLPVKRSSSKWSVTSVPRQKVNGPSLRIAATTRRLFTPRIPSIWLRVSAESTTSYSLRISRKASALPSS